MITGRVHAIAEVIVRGGMEDLFTFNSVALRAIGRKTRCGTFVVMRSSRKWTTAPDGWAEW